MANETMRIFFPLKIITYLQGEYELDDNPEDITSKKHNSNAAGRTKVCL